MLITNISWDTDGELIKELPTEVIVSDTIDEDEIADWLSDNWGFCVFSFSTENEKKTYGKTTNLVNPEVSDDFVSLMELEILEETKAKFDDPNDL